MTMEEMVEADRRSGSRLHFSDGVWWREVKPFFYLPANFMTRITPHRAQPKPWLALGGYYHMVAPGATGNGQIVTNEISHPADYQLDSLKANKRREVRRALAVFRICRVENLDDLLRDGFRVYLDWEKKTKNIRNKTIKVRQYLLDGSPAFSVIRTNLSLAPTPKVNSLPF